MFEKINNFIKDIDEYHFEERVYYKKVTPKFLTHDEICYHIDTLVSLECHYNKGVETFIFYKDSETEIIGEELEVDLEDFIDFTTHSLEYSTAINNMKGVLNKITVTT